MLTHSEAAQISVHIITLYRADTESVFLPMLPLLFGKTLLLAPAKLLCCSPLNCYLLWYCQKKIPNNSNNN